MKVPTLGRAMRNGSKAWMIAGLLEMAGLACAAAAAQSSGSAIYIPKCAGCHGANGVVASEYMKSRGTPDASDPNIRSLTANQMFASVKNGKGGMRPFKNRITDAEIKDAVAFYRELGATAPAPALAPAPTPAPAPEPVSVAAPPPPPAPMPEIAPPPPPADTPPPTIALGQTENQVTAILGQPLKAARLGAKVIFYYKDMKVTFTNGKVSNVE